MKPYSDKKELFPLDKIALNVAYGEAFNIRLDSSSGDAAVYIEGSIGDQVLSVKEASELSPTTSLDSGEWSLERHKQ